MCGGQVGQYGMADNLTLMNTCYVYNMADNEWSEGPTLKFIEYPSSSIWIELWLATVGNSLVAVFKQNMWYTIYMSILIDNEWSEPIAVDPNPGEQIFSMVAIDEKHFALLQATLHSGSESVEIINVETGSVIVNVPMDVMCFHGFLYNG